MSSQRFPGKMLYLVNDKPILEYVIDRVQHAKKIDDIIIATSNDPSDDAIVNYCRHKEINYYRGSLNNVASRFFSIVTLNPSEAFVRICGDRPLLDQNLIDKAVNIFSEYKYDIITNVFPPSFPAGQTVEIVNSNIFKKYFSSITNIEDLEHITKFFYENSRLFSIKNIASFEDNSSIHFAIDTENDMQLFKEIIETLKKPHWEYTLSDILEIYQKIRNVESI